MKIGVYSIPELNLGKYNIKDNRLDQIYQIVKSKKKTYAQVELVGEGAFLEADLILVLSDARVDLILEDLDFVETRLGRSEDEKERALLNKLKTILEKEQFVSSAGLTQEEKQLISGYGLLTSKPVSVIEKNDLSNQDVLLLRILKQSGFIVFFTRSEKETRAWLTRQGTTAWEAAGLIHSDIQKGFIRAEITSYDDFIQAGGEAGIKQAGKLHLEQKDYLMQDAELVNFRFNK